VVVLAYDGLCTFEFGVAVESSACRALKWATTGIVLPWRRLMKVSFGRRAGSASDRRRSELAEHADLIVVPGWRGMDSPVPDALCNALRQASARGCQVMSICSGVFVLAASGLLNGRRATTHWRYIETLKARFPAIDVVEDVLYQDEGDILTSAGSAAGIDLCLHVSAGISAWKRRIALPAGWSFHLIGMARRHSS
jgi:AraC family transcriptional activator FtrA